MSYIGKIKQAKRSKVFTDGKQTPIDRNDRARVMFLAHTARGKREITRAAVDILRVLLYHFANLNDGRCFPSYQTIADEARCNPRTVGRCLPDLEAAGFLTWVHRILRVRERVEGLGHIWATVWRVNRTSNAYDFPMIAKKPHQNDDKGQKALGTSNQATFPFIASDLNPENPLDAALLSFGRTRKEEGFY
jgi:hypothetical protein